ncbi:MAG: GIY-YIG nuclease family protein, partial [Candidatus Thiodiazotropha sp.]
NENTCQIRMNELRSALTRQKYPINVIEKGIEKAMKIRKEELRIVRQKNDDNIITFVSTFNPLNPELFIGIRQNLPILHQDEIMNEILKEYQIIKSKRQPRNLKRLLTRAKFTDTNESPKIKKCNRSNCGLCEHLITETDFAFQSGKTFKVKCSMSCEVKNLIYVIRCCGCQEEYIGETGDTLRHRVTVHKQQIRDPSTRMLYVSGHIDNCARNQTTKFKILPLYKMQNDNAAARKMKENFFIDLFKPKLNRHI